MRQIAQPQARLREGKRVSTLITEEVRRRLWAQMYDLTSQTAASVSELTGCPYGRAFQIAYRVGAVGAALNYPAGEISTEVIGQAVAAAKASGTASPWATQQPASAGPAPAAGETGPDAKAEPPPPPPAEAQRAERQHHNDIKTRRALSTCPPDLLITLARGNPTAADLQQFDRLADCPEELVNQRQHDGAYGQYAKQAAQLRSRGQLSRVQVMAREAMKERGLGYFTPSGFFIPPKGAEQLQSGRSFRLAAGLASMVLSIPVLIQGVIWFWQGGNETVPDSGTVTGNGVAFILAGLAMLLVPPVIAVIRSTYQAHQRWISHFPPGQQAAVRTAEKAAAWTATAAAAVALHEQHKRADAKLSASVIGTGPGPGRSGQAMWQAKQTMEAQHQRDEAGRKHQELLDAIRQPGQQQDPTAALLERSKQTTARQRLQATLNGQPWPPQHPGLSERNAHLDSDLK